MAETMEHTPGPWGWFGNAPHEIYLATTHSGRRFVMGFRRWGMTGAQPMFQVNQRMVPASTLITFEVGENAVVGYDAARKDGSVYRYQIDGISHADAHLIAAAPDLLAALEAIFHPDNEPLIYWVGDDAHAQTLRDNARAAVAKARGRANLGDDQHG